MAILAPALIAAFLLLAGVGRFPPGIGGFPG